MEQLVLIGFMGAGKTTIGRLLARQKNVPFYDLDELIVLKIGMSIPAFFEGFGEEEFRKVEHQMLKERLLEPGIIATGGGIVTQLNNRQLLKNAPQVIYLAANPEVTFERIRQDEQATRPLADQKSLGELVTLFESRQLFYKECSHSHIDTSDLSPIEVVQMIDGVINTKEIEDKL